MTPEHQQQREALGAYVVGALDPAERRDIELHLRECDSCTGELARLSALPGMLGRVSDQEVEAGLLVPSQDLLDGVIRRLADTERKLRTQLRQWRLTAAAACLVALAAVVVALAPWDAGPDRMIVTADPVTAGSTSATGQVAAIAWEWGTTVELQAADLPRRETYALWAVATDGRRERAGTWGVTSSGRAVVRGASSIARSELARVEVTDPAGEVILVFRLSGRT
ncbi:hypothetical protein BH23ACT10_BH23ACT10_05970 [soil metagenome]